jgi:hypothetical protein
MYIEKAIAAFKKELVRIRGFSLSGCVAGEAGLCSVMYIHCHNEEVVYPRPPGEGGLYLFTILTSSPGRLRRVV